MVKAVFLDIDNTLLDFDAFVKAAMRDGFCKFGLGEYRDDMFPVFLRINTEVWREIEQGRLRFDEMQKIRWNRVFDALGICFDGIQFEKYFRNYLFECAIPVEGAAELLAYLKEKYILCVASNGPYDQQLNRLRLGGMLDCFSKVFVSERIGASKPSPKFFTHCLNELNEIAPDEIMMIGDSLSSDMTGAAGMGMKTCYFDRNQSGNTGGLSVDYVVHSLEEIRSFL